LQEEDTMAYVKKEISRWSKGQENSMRLLVFLWLRRTWVLLFDSWVHQNLYHQSRRIASFSAELDLILRQHTDKLVRKFKVWVMSRLLWFREVLNRTLNLVSTLEQWSEVRWSHSIHIKKTWETIWFFNFT
jgi:hypothetical protein